MRGFLVPKGTPGFTTQDIHKKLSLRASVTSELLFDDVRLPANAVLPEAITKPPSRSPARPARCSAPTGSRSSIR